MVPVNGIVEITRIQTEAWLTRFLPSISYWWDPAHWLIYRGDDTKFYHLVQFCLNSRMYRNWTFLGVMYDRLGLSCSLMVYSPGNWPMPWNLSGNFLMRSSVELIGTVFLAVGGAGVGSDSWEVSWMTLIAQFILMTSNLSHDGSPRMVGPEVSATYQQEFIWSGCALGEPGWQVIGPWCDPKRGIWLPLEAVSLVLLTLRPVGWTFLSM